MLSWTLAFLFSAAQAPGGEMPAVLLAAPVNATWAANHADYWANLGFRGFLFEGIVEGLDDPRWTSFEDPSSIEPESPLLAEIRLANLRLGEAGIDANFLRVAMAPEGAYFTEGQRRDEALARIERAARFCRKARLRGLALDTRPTSLLYDHRWDGYDPDSAETGQIEEAARDFGRALTRTFLRQCPKGELIVQANELRQAGALWPGFAAGLVEGCGAAADMPMHWLLGPPRRTGGLAELRAAWDDCQSLLAVWLGQVGYQRATSRGGPLLALEPIGYLSGGIPQAYLPPGDFRILLSAAQILSGSYVAIAAPEGGWWDITRREEAEYAHLRQGASAAVRRGAPVLRPFERATVDAARENPYRVSTPLSGHVRLGPFDGLSETFTRPYVTRNGAGAGLLAWAGRTTLAPWLDDAHRLVLTRRTQAVVVTELASGERQYHTPRQGHVSVPLPDAPVLVEGLPLRDWAVPASLWLRPETPFVAGLGGAAVRFGYTNPSQMDSACTLALSASEGFAVGASGFEATIEAGERLSYTRTVRGAAQAGSTVDLGLTLTLPPSPPIHRRFSFPVLPAMRWEHRMDGVPAGSPAMARLAGDGQRHVVVCGGRGDVVCLAPEGGPHWRRRFQDRLTGIAVAGRLGDEPMVVAVCGQRGRLRMLDERGATLREAVLGAPGVEGCLVHGRVDGQSRFFAALEDGRIASHAIGEASDWKFATALSVRTLDMLVVAGAPILLAGLDGAQPRMLCLEGNGSFRWTARLPAAPSSKACPLPPAMGRPPSVVVGLEDGRMAVLDAVTGLSTLHTNTRARAPLLAIKRISGHALDAVDIAVLDSAALWRQSLGGAPQWTRAIGEASALTVFEQDGGACLVVSTATGELHAFNGTGKRLWTERRAAGAVRGPMAIGDLDGDGQPEGVYAAADYMIRAIALGPDGGGPSPVRVYRGGRKVTGN